MSNVVRIPSGLFEETEVLAKIVLRIIGGLLPKGTAEEKAEVAETVLKVVLMVPMGEFLNLRYAAQDYQRMFGPVKEEVLSRVRVLLTELRTKT